MYQACGSGREGSYSITDAPRSPTEKVAFEKDFKEVRGEPCRHLGEEHSWQWEQPVHRL